MLTIQSQKNLKTILEFEEGRRNKLYKDTLGNDTIGIGHLCANGFSDAVIDLMFLEDWTICYNWLVKTFEWFPKLDTVRQLAIISLVFNIGSQSFLKFFGLIHALSVKDFVDAKKHVLSALYAKQVPKRAQRIAYMLETGTYPQEYNI